MAARAARIIRSIPIIQLTVTVGLGTPFSTATLAAQVMGAMVVMTILTIPVTQVTVMEGMALENSPL
jgi:hypothetical protein